MYKMYVRPKLEYCVQAWNPVYSGDIDLIEKVQNRFTRLLPQGNSMTPTERNEALNITDHKTRWLRGDLIHIYKMIGDGELFSRVLEARTRGHNKKLLVPQSIINIRKHSFSVRNINVWNMLPEHIVIAETLNIFKSKIDVFLCESNVA